MRFMFDGCEQATANALTPTRFRHTHRGDPPEIPRRVEKRNRMKTQKPDQLTRNLGNQHTAARRYIRMQTNFNLTLALRVAELSKQSRQTE